MSINFVKDIENPIQFRLWSVHVAGIDCLQNDRYAVSYHDHLITYHHVLNKINVSTLVLIKDIKDALRQIFGLIAIKVFWNLNEHFPAEAAFWTHFHKATELFRYLFLTIS